MTKNKKLKVDPVFQADMELMLAEYLAGKYFTMKPVLVTSNLNAKWYIAFLDKNGFKPIIQNLGAGVKKIRAADERGKWCRR